MPRPGDTRGRILRFALGLPGAWEDQPWEDDVVAKVDKKIFVFLGPQDSNEHGMSVKLDESHEQALAVPGAAPTGYGVGRGGWVTVPFRDTTPPLEVLKDWVVESYCRVAPKRLVAELQGRRRSLAATSQKGPRPARPGFVERRSLRPEGKR